MKPARSTLTVTFEAPFWVGLYEREEEGLYQVCKITFGAEPKDYEVYAFLQRHWRSLTFSPPLPAERGPTARISPKRLQREQRAQARKAHTRQNKAAEQDRQYALRREKRKERHKGH